MFADDTNLFFTHKDIRYLFQIVNQELENIKQWFVSNKLSLNIRKNKILIFPQIQSKRKHSTSFTKTNNKRLRNATNRTFIIVILLDENFSWKEHIKYSENKVAQNLGLLYKAKHYVNKRSFGTSVPNDL